MRDKEIQEGLADPQHREQKWTLKCRWHVPDSLQNCKVCY